MTEKNEKPEAALAQCVISLINQAESSKHDGAEAMRLTQAAVNATNAILNLQSIR